MNCLSVMRVPGIFVLNDIVSSKNVYCTIVLLNGSILTVNGSASLIIVPMIFPSYNGSVSISLNISFKMPLSLVSHAVLKKNLSTRELIMLASLLMEPSKAK